MSLQSKGLRVVAMLCLMAAISTAAWARTTITFMTPLGGEDGGFMDEIIAEFNATHPDIEVVHLVVVDSVEYTMRLSTGIAAATAPEVLFIRKFDMPPFLPHLKSFTAEELLGYGVDVADIFPALIEGLVVEDRVHGIPLDAWIFYLAYNRDNFARAGLNPDDPPANLDEWMSAMEALKAVTPEGLTPFYQGIGWAWLFVHLMWQFGGDLLTPDFREPAFEEAGAQALHILLEMQDRGIAPKVPVAGTPPFLAGDTSAFIIGVWTVRAFEEVLGENFGVAPAPQFGTHKSVFGGSHVLALPEVMVRNPVVLNAAMTWVRYLWDNALDWYAAGQTPARISIAESAEFRERLPHIYTIAQQLPYVRTFPFFPHISSVVDEIAPYVEQVLFLRDITPEEAMRRAAEDVAVFLEDYWMD